MTTREFAICIGNESYAASLELWKVYAILPDAEARQHRYLRVIDESGEDYLYPEQYFVPLTLPKIVEDAMNSEKIAV